jgi:hypothetical protein
LPAVETGNAIEALEGLTYDSPRGKVHLDPATHYSHAPVYEALVQKNKKTGCCKLTVIKESGATGKAVQKIGKIFQGFSRPFYRMAQHVAMFKPISWEFKYFPAIRLRSNG